MRPARPTGMRLLRVLLAGLVTSASLVVVTAAPSFACSCATFDTEEQVADAAVVVTGTVVSVQPPTGGEVMSSADPVTYVVDVERVLKGEPSDPLEVLSAAHGASCGIEGIGTGDRVVLFASPGAGGGAADGALWASLCGGTTTWSAELEAAAAEAAGGEAGTAEPVSVPVSGGPPATEQTPAVEGGSLALPVGLAAGGLPLLLAVWLWFRLGLRR